MKKTKLPLILLIIFVLFWIILGITPYDRYLWFIENAILLIFLIVLITTYNHFQFSNISYILIFLFAILQTIGAHYTYALVPFDFITQLFEFERNNYDRLVHFSFGLLLAYPFRELLIRTSGIKHNFWSYLLPIGIVFALGAVYEIIEWLFAILHNPQATHLFLNSQGDEWDAQMDMLLAGVGSCIAMIITKLFQKKEYL